MTGAGTAPWLRVATANAASGRAASPASAPPDLGPFARDAAGLDVDVLGVQELDHLLERSRGVDQTADLVDALARGGAPWHARFAAAVHGTPGNARTMRHAPATDLAEPSYGVALLSRHPVEEWWEHRMEPSSLRVKVARPTWTDEQDVVVGDEPRVALAGRVAGPGGAVTVVTTHLSFVPWRAGGQLRELAGWARSLPRPLVLLGDLNLPGRIPSLVTGWSAVAAGPTYPADRPAVRLDHVLLDAGTTSLRAAGPATLHRLGASDHLAVRAELVG
jgi:endonuclease/exonuclease/phosphatase family metal-dependent hydrolase